jgi:hypothetical protein
MASTLAQQQMQSPVGGRRGGNKSTRNNMTKHLRMQCKSCKIWTTGEDNWTLEKSFQCRLARYGQREKTIGLLEKKSFNVRLARYGQHEKTIGLLQQSFLTILQIFFLSR